MQLAVLLDVSQQVERRGFVGPDGEPPGSVVAQLFERVVELLLQALESAGILQDDAAGIRRRELLAGAVDELLAELLLQTLEGERYRGLRPQELFGRPGKALFRQN